MGKLDIVFWLLRVVWHILTDTDNDGRPDLFDSDPNNPDVK